VIANGVMIASAATISLSGLTQGHLTQGLVLTLILNTSTNPISGTFATCLMAGSSPSTATTSKPITKAAMGTISH